MSATSRRLPPYPLIGVMVGFLILILTYSLLPSTITNTSSSFSNRIHTSSSNVQDALSYRQHLEETTSPASQIKHSKTLTFDHIYVLSLPTRLDRREQMMELARAHGLELTFVDAVNKDEPFIKWIAERAVEVRKERLRIMAEVRGVAETSLGGLHVGNDWLVQTPSPNSSTPFPPLLDPRYPSGDWISHLEAHDESKTLHLLKPLNPNLNVHEALYDPNEKIDGRQVNEGVISTFWGHSRAMKMVLKNRDKSALILEDDVDVEWDLKRLWSRVERRLPRDWDATLLGHCWGKELLQPQYLHPHLHRSTVPLCLHAYALSSSGAKRLLNLLLNPWTAYQTAVDTAVPSFIQFNLLTSFSLEPPLIIQRKDGPSDIQKGIGSKWRGLLMDSTVERIRKAKGEEVWEDVFDPEALDPATIFRYGNNKKCHA